MDKSSQNNSKKYKINIDCTKDGEWYLKSLSINADTKEDFKETLEEARRVVKYGFSSIEKPQKTKKSIKQEIQLNQEDQKLFERLKIKRNEIANEKNFPSYLIFNNSTLAYFASKKPQTQEEMLLIHGVGEKKFQDYGEIFLKEIADYCKN